MKYIVNDNFSPIIKYLWSMINKVKKEIYEKTLIYRPKKEFLVENGIYKHKKVYSKNSKYTKTSLENTNYVKEESYENIKRLEHQLKTLIKFKKICKCLNYMRRYPNRDKIIGKTGFSYNFSLKYYNAYKVHGMGLFKYIYKKRESKFDKYFDEILSIVKNKEVIPLDYKNIYNEISNRHPKIKLTKSALEKWMKKNDIYIDNYNYNKKHYCHHEENPYPYIQSFFDYIEDKYISKKQTEDNL